MNWGSHYNSKHSFEITYSVPLKWKKKFNMWKNKTFYNLININRLQLISQWWFFFLSFSITHFSYEFIIIPHPEQKYLNLVLKIVDITQTFFLEREERDNFSENRKMLSWVELSVKRWEKQVHQIITYFLSFDNSSKSL